MSRWTAPGTQDLACDLPTKLAGLSAQATRLQESIDRIAVRIADDANASLSLNKVLHEREQKHQGLTQQMLDTQREIDRLRAQRPSSDVQHEIKTLLGDLRGGDDDARYAAQLRLQVALRALLETLKLFPTDDDPSSIRWKAVSIGRWAEFRSVSGH